MPHSSRGVPICKLCHSAAEDTMHFLYIGLPSSPEYQGNVTITPPPPPPILSTYTSSPNLLISYLLGTSWLDDLPTQKFTVNYTRAQKSPCRPDYAINDITTTLPYTTISGGKKYKERRRRRKGRGSNKLSFCINKELKHRY